MGFSSEIDISNMVVDICQVKHHPLTLMYTPKDGGQRFHLKL